MRTTSAISRAFVLKWYVIRPGLIRARSAIRTNDVFAYPSSAIVEIAVSISWARRAASMKVPESRD